MSSPTLANLRRQLRNAEARQRQAMVMTWLVPAPGSRGHRNPMGTPGYVEHTNLTIRVIPNLHRRIKAAEAKAAARRRWNALRKNIAAKSIAKYLHATTYRPPNQARRNLGGVGYRRLAGSTNVGSPTLARLMRQLEELKAANRGNKVNIYNRMSNTWGRAGNAVAAANIMNAAQKIMSRAGLLGRS